MSARSRAQFAIPQVMREIQYPLPHTERTFRPYVFLLWAGIRRVHRRLHQPLPRHSQVRAGVVMHYSRHEMFWEN